MTLEEINQRLKQFKIKGTEQHWFNDVPMSYNNDYISLITVRTSNKTGGTSVDCGKQWSIIIRLDKDFTRFDTWRSLIRTQNIALTKVTKGDYAGFWGIRVYDMSRNPTNEIVKDLLDYIFD